MVWHRQAPVCVRIRITVHATLCAFPLAAPRGLVLQRLQLIVG